MAPPFFTVLFSASSRFVLLFEYSSSFVRITGNRASMFEYWIYEFGFIHTLSWNSLKWLRWTLDSWFFCIHFSSVKNQFSVLKTSLDWKNSVGFVNPKTPKLGKPVSGWKRPSLATSQPFRLIDIAQDVTRFYTWVYRVYRVPRHRHPGEIIHPRRWRP